MTSRRARPSQWICTARFTADVEGERKFAIARIGRPKKQRIDWGCKLFISNVGMEEPIVVVGIDQMQSLLLAFEGILTILRDSGIEWRWIYGEAGDIGIPRYVPGGFGRKFAAKLEAMIDSEIDKLGKAAKRRHYRNLKKRRVEAQDAKSSEGTP